MSQNGRTLSVSCFAYLLGCVLCKSVIRSHDAHVQIDAHGNTLVERKPCVIGSPVTSTASSAALSAQQIEFNFTCNAGAVLTALSAQHLHSNGRRWQLACTTATAFQLKDCKWDNEWTEEDTDRLDAAWTRGSPGRLLTGMSSRQSSNEQRDDMQFNFFTCQPEAFPFWWKAASDRGWSNSVNGALDFVVDDNEFLYSIQSKRQGQDRLFAFGTVKLCADTTTATTTTTTTATTTTTTTTATTTSPTPSPTTPVLPTPLPSTPRPTQQVVVGGACPRGSTLTTIPAVDGEIDSSWILASNGTVYGSGVGLFDNGDYKTEVTEYLTGVKAIASGWGHTLFLMENGVVCGRGNNYQYNDFPLCDVPTDKGKAPVVVMTGVKSFSTHSRTSIFLKENGDLYGCGSDRYGQLGQGSPSDTRRTPVLIKTNVKSAWAGRLNVLMELLNGSTFVIGNDAYHQFGFDTKWTSTVTGVSSRQEVAMELPPPEGLKPFGAADNKFWYTDSQSTLYGQGMNYYCEMGLPETGVRGNVPTNPRMAPVMHNIKAVASKSTTVFLLKNGTAYTSGKNEAGEVGDGSKEQRCGLYWAMDHVQAVATGKFTSFLLAEDGTVYGSGTNSNYQLGNSSYGRSSLSFVKILTID